MAQIYLICPVRNCSEEVNKYMKLYVSKLERDGHEVHFPPRDVEQDQEGYSICDAHRTAMLEADEVHFWWDPDSKGSHFDFGMAFMLDAFKEVKFVTAKDIEETPHKSYSNVIRDLVK